MKYWKRLALTGALAIAAGGIATGQTASAGDAGEMTVVQIDLYIFGTEAQNIGDWLPEMYVGAGTDAVANCAVDTPNNYGPFNASVQIDCPVFDDGDGEVDITVGYRDGPAAYSVFAGCSDFGQNSGSQASEERLPNTTPSLTVDQFSNANCYVDMVTSVVVIDKAFEPHTIEDFPNTTLPGDATPATDPVGGAAPGDFTFELYDGDGELYGDTAVDVDPEYCTVYDIGSSGDTPPCVAIDVAQDTYTLGEITTYGYRPVAVDCGLAQYYDEALGDDFPGAEFEVDDNYQVFHCQVENEYVERQVTVSVDVVNDSGGTATPSDFTMELYRADDLGTTVVTGVCDDVTKVCIDDQFPIGDYVVGQMGPDGYTVIEVNQTDAVNELEALTETNAAFTLGEFSIIEVEVVNGDPEPDPTTTTAAPTTTTTTTTVAPTTTAPAAITTTTAFDSAGITLPSTGGGQQSSLALAALMLLLLGGGAIALARREN